MFADTTLSAFSAEQIKSACFAMLEVARAHGISAAEHALIQTFWQQAEPALGAFDAHSQERCATALFVDAGQQQLLLDLCLACAFADGHYSSEEKAVIADLAARLGLAESVLAERTAEVRSAFLGALAHLPDAASVAALGKQLA